MARDMMNRDSMMRWTVVAFLVAILFGFLLMLAEPNPGFLRRLMMGLTWLGGTLGFLGLLLAVIRRYLDDGVGKPWIDLYAILGIVLALIVAVAVLGKSSIGAIM